MAEYTPLYIEGHKLVVMGLNLHYAGSPIILLHGITQSIEYWRTDPVFSRLGPCYAISLPGHFPAQFPANFDHSELSEELIGRLLVRAIRQLVGHKRVTVVGFSTGGFSALTLAALIPQQIERIICIAGFSRGKWNGILGLAQVGSRLGWVGQIVTRGVVKLLFSNLFFYQLSQYMAMGAFCNGRSKSVFREMLDNTFPNAKAIKVDSMMAYFEMMPDLDISHLFSHIRVPTFVLTGDKDPIVPPTESYQLSYKLPQAKLVVLPGAGHLVAMEYPHEYQTVLQHSLSA
jgi:pimeloyl-ACP methyl ester carboxylesterase